ncbi:MAG: PAS domain S-box protein [bacterium]|nr:PAS domain S-box protein [bacterium]
MNALPFIHFFCFIFYVYLAIFFIARNPRAPLNRACAAVMVCFALWSFGGIVSHDPDSTKAAVFFIEDVTAPGWAFFSSFFLWGIVLFTRHPEPSAHAARGALKKTLFYLLLFLPPIVFLYKQWTNYLVVDFIKYHFGWGIVWANSIWVLLYYVYIGAFLVVGQFLVFRCWRKSTDRSRKKQAKILFFTTMATAVMGISTDIVLPRLNIYVMPDIADVAAIITAAGLAYIVVKYKFMTITPAIAAENIIATMADSLVLLDADGIIVKVNQAIPELTGYRENELKGKPLHILMPNQLVHTANSLLEETRKGKKIINFELSFKSRQGLEIPVIFSSSALKNEDGTVIGMVSISRDITQRKTAEKELKAHKEHLEEMVEERTEKLEEINRQLHTEKEKYQTLTENINSGIFRHTADDAGDEGKFIEANPAILKMFGYEDKNDFLATTFSRHCSDPEDMERFNRKMRKYGSVKGDELQLKKKDGTLFTGSVAAAAVKNSRGEMLYYDGIIEDISVRKQLEEQLMLAQRIEAVDRLTGGIAHEFNNMLASIIGYSELSQMELGPENPVDDYLNGILSVTQRSQKLIGQLMTFSRKTVTEPKVFNLNRFFSALETLIQQMIGENISFDFIPGDDLANVEADPGQFEQVVMNLAANAGDAMPSGGKFAITTENKEVDEALVEQYPYMEQGSYVLVTVSDTGCGMSRERISHIFEPFFTTKKSGRAGLGLSTVYGIVKQSKGIINFDSEPGRGTVVTIYLPRADKQLDTITKKIGTLQLTPGNETILLVEDEEQVREALAKILSKCGYDILPAGNGEDALKLWRKNKNRVDLLLTDIVLPGISGLQLAQKLLEIKSRLKVIYMSGYSDEVISQYGALDKGISFIQKPFTSAVLTEKIKEILN